MTTTAVEPVASIETDREGLCAAADVEATEEARRLVADLPVLVEALASVADPLERARVATQLRESNRPVTALRTFES